ncbi:hypothetical protein MCUN1_000876 [Malassezia cuniculi]|uniref:Uncharacterized protein n=1 Tax=Malassezia cuniculi TaxID=948313 RepID=A0AAF0J5B2_9BASI|nr:hypothetical protein MCUN1_000876 [Malassezia cuniculi]
MHPRPTMSLSLPPVPVDADLLAKIAPLVEHLEQLYSTVVMYHSPDGAKIPLSIEDAALLPYSLASGRAMMARAVQCQSHVEVLISDSGAVSILDDSTTLEAYLQRLEQLARAVNVVTLAILPGKCVGATTSLSELRTAWDKHAIAKQGNVHFVDLSAAQDAWGEISERLDIQRAAWN